MAKRKFTPLIEIEEQPLLESHKDVRLKYCESSDKVYLNKRWVKYNPDILGRIIKESLIFEKFTEITNIEVELQPEPLEEKEAMVYVSARKNNQDIHQEYPIPYKIIREESPMISKEKSGQYYQGIFQLIEGSEEAITKAQELIASARKKGVFMSKFIETDKQCDFYLSDNHFLGQMAKKMQTIFGGTLNITSTLHTFDHQTSRELHRVTITLFCFRFTKNELLERHGSVYIVEAIQKQAKLRDILSDEKISIDAKDAREYKILKREKTTICQRVPEVTALHPETFQETPIKVLDGSNIPETEEIEVYVLDDFLYYTSS